MTSPSSSSHTTNPLDEDHKGSLDLGLDPSDPLNLLLHSTSFSSPPSSSNMTESTTSGGSPPSWSDLTSLWPTDQDRKPPFDWDLSAFPAMDTDMDTGLQQQPEHGIDPSALQMGFPIGENPFITPDMLSNFDFQSIFDSAASTSSQSSRRLSVTSSSSSSGASLSPIMDHPQPSLSPAPPPIMPQMVYSDDPAIALAQRVAQLSGVTVAVPQPSQMHLFNNMTIPGGVQQFSFPLGPPSAISSSSVSSASSTPPPGTPESSVSQPASTSAKPKTSHTTIERRYRTNLNARIQSLRMAVPALRVVEDRESTSSRKVKVKVPIGQVMVGKFRKPSGEEEEFVDVVDDRGFVDGVKVARKCSKANVLGKAVEYIRVLKKREARQKREQEGLKSLIGGLVGGSALLREWEREWKLNFGGEEKDEVEGDDLEDLGSDDEDEDDDEDGRKRKKPKVAPAPKKEVTKKPPPPPPQPIMGPDGQMIVPEKRKRGRPRKVQPLPTPQPTSYPNLDLSAFSTPQQQFQSQAPTPQPNTNMGTQQYLLATFALVSFFNSPFSSSSPATNQSEQPHSHSGHVLSPHPALPVGWTLHDVIQIVHLFVSAAVFLSIVLPWLPKSLHFSLGSSPESRPSSSLASTLLPERRGQPNEAEQIYASLGSRDIGMTSTVKRLLTGKGPKREVGFQRQGLEQRAWVRLGELCVAEGQSASTWRRLQIYWHMRAHLAWLNCGASDLSTAALLLFPLSKSMATNIWVSARERKAAVQVRAHERLVLESVTVDEAYALLKQMPAEDKARWTPVQAIARALIRERVKTHLETMFVKSVLPDEDEITEVTSNANSEGTEERDRRNTIDAARSLGGEVARLGELLYRMSASPGADDDMAALAWELSEGDIKTLFSVILHYRRIFPSSATSTLLSTGNATGVSILLSPPPSPSRKDGKWHYALRCALGSSLFDGEEGLLEEARDRVVDMLVEAERTGKVSGTAL